MSWLDWHVTLQVSGGIPWMSRNADSKTPCGEIPVSDEMFHSRGQRKTAYILQYLSRLIIMRCNQCGDYLFGKPKIIVDDVIYCYRCAHKEVSHLNASRRWAAQAQYDTEKEAYDKVKTVYGRNRSEWLEKRRKYVGNSQIGEGPAFWLTIIYYFIDPNISKYFDWSSSNRVLRCFVTFIFLYVVTKIIIAVITGYRDTKFRAMYPEPTFNEARPLLNPFAEVNHYLDANDGSSLINQNYRNEILQRDDFMCQICGRRKRKSEDLEVHHVLPRSEGGKDEPTNLVTLCRHCHDREVWYGHVRAYPTTLKKPKQRS